MRNTKTMTMALGMILAAVLSKAEPALPDISLPAPHMEGGKGLSAEEMGLLDAHIFLATLEAVDDPYVTIGDPQNVERWRVTIEERRPDVLWVDPWGDVQAGDANAETDARYTISELTKILGAVNPNSAVTVLAHARTGVKNIIEAIGYDGASGCASGAV